MCLCWLRVRVCVCGKSLLVLNAKSGLIAVGQHFDLTLYPCHALSSCETAIVLPLQIFSNWDVCEIPENQQKILWSRKTGKSNGEIQSKKEWEREMLIYCRLMWEVKSMQHVFDKCRLPNYFRLSRFDSMSWNTISTVKQPTWSPTKLFHSFVLHTFRLMSNIPAYNNHL